MKEDESGGKDFETLHETFFFCFEGVPPSLPRGSKVVVDTSQCPGK
jgi:hypothetical protein